MSAVHHLLLGGQQSASPVPFDLYFQGSSSVDRTFNVSVPPGHTSISAVCVGAGNLGGGGLSYRNNIPVQPHDLLTIFIGYGVGSKDGRNTVTTIAVNGVVVLRARSGSGLAGGPADTSFGATSRGGGDSYSGVSDTQGGGGGAGGYNGFGGRGQGSFGAATSGTGGAGGGGGLYGGGGGGVGLNGGTSGGAAATAPALGGQGGASGAPGGTSSQRTGGQYGGGAGFNLAGGGTPGIGGVHIFGGGGRSFPNNAQPV